MAHLKLRFKREDGMEFPEWEKGCLIDIAKKVNRTANEDSTAPIMMISQGNGFIHQSEKYSRDNAGKSLEKYTLLKYGEMAYNHGASKAKPYGVTYCLQEEKEARIPFVYHSFCIANGVPKYWNYALNTSQMDRQLKKMVSSGARMDGLLNINYDTYMQTKIFMPCLEEQQKIADFLSTVDEVIAQSEAEVQNLEQQKKAAMQKIFSQEVRFRREDGTEYLEWEELTMDDIFTEIIEKDRTDLPVLSILQGQGTVYRDSSDRNIMYDKKSTVNYKAMKKGDFIIHLRTFEGGLECATLDGISSPAYKILRTNRLIPEAYKGYFRSKQFIDGRLAIAVTGVRDGKNIEMSTFWQIIVPVPCLEEQQKIADFLSAYDEAISYAKQELDKWKELKKGLLQQMFV